MQQDRNMGEVASEKIPNVFVGALDDGISSAKNLVNQEDVFGELDMMEEQKGPPKINVQAPEGNLIDMEVAMKLQNNNLNDDLLSDNNTLPKLDLKGTPSDRLVSPAASVKTLKTPIAQPITPANVATNS